MLEIRVIANSKKARVVKGEPLKVYVSTPAKDGKANAAVIKILSDFYGKPVRIVSGHKSRKKIIDMAK